MYCSFLEILHPHSGPSLCLSPSFHVTLSFFFYFLSALISISFPLFFSYFKFLIQISSPVLSVLPGPLLFLYPCVLFYIAASLHQCSDSFLLCFTLLHGQVAEQLAYYGHVSETVITEEMFDAAVQFGTVQGDPTQSWARRPVWIAPRVAPSTDWERSIKDGSPHTSTASQVGSSGEEGETVGCQMTRGGRSTKGWQLCKMKEENL